MVATDTNLCRGTAKGPDWQQPQSATKYGSQGRRRGRSSSVRNGAPNKGVAISRWWWWHYRARANRDTLEIEEQECRWAGESCGSKQHSGGRRIWTGLWDSSRQCIRCCLGGYRRCGGRGAGVVLATLMSTTSTQVLTSGTLGRGEERDSGVCTEEGNRHRRSPRVAFEAP